MKPLSSGTRNLKPNLSLCLVFILVLGVGFPLIDAADFGIYLDNTCLVLIKNNLSSNCPTYEDILTLYPDTSNKEISGGFAYNDGIYQREPNHIINSYAYYQFHNESIMFIDPDTETKQNIKTIEIKANLKGYKLPYNQGYDNENRTLTVGYGRFIDSCQSSYIDANLWATIIGDTINHINQNCSKNSTRFSDTRTTELHKTIFDISTTYKFQLEAWQKEMIKACGYKICINEPDQPKQPKQNTRD